MKWFKGLGLLLLGIYLIACMGLYLIQEKLIFNPHELPENHRFRTGEEIEIKVSDDASLNALWMQEPNAKGLVIYLHGNKGNLRRCTRQAQMVAGNDFDILMPDYRGFGKSDGYIYSEAQLLNDAQKVYDWALQHYEENQIVLLGYSLGTGMASYLAAQNQPAHLAMVAPYLSFVDLKNRNFPYVPNFLLKYHLHNDDHLQKVDCTVTLFHGTEDEVIPYDSSEILQKINPERVQLVRLDRESHRGAIFNNLFRQTMSDLLRSF